MFPFRTVGLLPRSAFFQGFLRLADDPLNLPGRLFHRAVDLQTGIIRQLPCFRSDPAFYFVKLAYGRIFRAWFHHNCSLGQDSGQQSRCIPPEKVQMPFCLSG